MCLCVYGSYIGIFVGHRKIKETMKFFLFKK